MISESTSVLTESSKSLISSDYLSYKIILSDILEKIYEKKIQAYLGVYKKNITSILLSYLNI